MWPLALSMGCATHNRAAADPPPAAGCHLIPDPLQAAAPFYEPGGAYAQHPLEVSHARQTWRGELVGAEVRIRATPGATSEYLERVLWCHAIGSGPAASPNDPLRPAGGVADVRVRSVGRSFAVMVLGRDAVASKDVAARAHAMVGSEGATLRIADANSTVVIDDY